MGAVSAGRGRLQGDPVPNMANILCPPLYFHLAVSCLVAMFVSKDYQQITKKEKKKKKEKKEKKEKEKDIL